MIKRTERSSPASILEGKGRKREGFSKLAKRKETKRGGKRVHELNGTKPTQTAAQTLSFRKLAHVKVGCISHLECLKSIYNYGFGRQCRDFQT